MAKSFKKCKECGNEVGGVGKKHKTGCSLSPSAGKTTKGHAKPGYGGWIVDGRTKLSVLIRLEKEIATEIGKRDKKEVSQVRTAMEEVDDLRKKLAEAESLIA